MTEGPPPIPPPQPQPPRDTAEELQLALGMLVRQLRTAADGGVSLSQVSVLKRLDRLGPSTASELARAEKIRPQSVIATVNTLQAGGHVVRTPHPTDGRQLLISLTPGGRAFVRERREAGHGRIAELIAERLTPAEQRLLAEAVPLLRRLAED
ncbi:MULTISPECIES: MarR family winged helix-turn-helix transcriptional regulator [unclassified Streptomyces]|uniref:MarR family winged helix-turn-helix transcriptional regulator n=1 Tax=unclassified Streptomyces TaxID=2593676 RepID=UPI0022525F85|nr:MULTISPECIES: MarR family transcriptional regulator [unclassified Streptomyces]MCX4524611.1 MarR family transcriptional regulator [Streptomyces sp. NBC_01551]MCX4544865.1 MarR family transcriptional regulator [Streptomyces sp. NBC_01565]